MSEPEHLPDRAVIRIEGDDRRHFLQGLITQDIERVTGGVTGGAAIFAALLTPQGKILFEFFIAEAGDALLLDCQKETAPALLKRLTLYKLRAKVDLRIDEDLHVLASETPITTDGAAFADPRLAALGWRAIANGPDENNNTGAYTARRIAYGVPECGVDFGPDETFLLDVNADALHGVNYKKGCFIGQEVTSRMKRKGEVRRRTLIAQFTGPAPEKATPVTAGASTLGEIMSGTDGAALAQIRLDRWEKAKADGADITAGAQTLRLRIPGYLEQG